MLFKGDGATRDSESRDCFRWLCWEGPMEEAAFAQAHAVGGVMLGAGEGPVPILSTPPRAALPSLSLCLWDQKKKIKFPSLNFSVRARKGNPGG